MNKSWSNRNQNNGLTDLERFWEKVEIVGVDDCWEWQGHKNPRGYGHFSIKHQMVKAHRYSWTIQNGEIPAGMVICHRCDNPPCVNPNHLFMATQEDNVHDMENKGRRVTVVKHGEESTNAKLNKALVIEMRQKYETGKYSFRELGIIYGIHKSTAHSIVKGDRYR